MKKLWKFFPLLATAAAVLSACGGGGEGSSGTVSAEYKITLTADKVQLPINIQGRYPGDELGYTGTGVYSPYTTVLHVNATVANATIPGGEETFACNLVSGLKDSALYYLDGDEEHMVDVKRGEETIKIPGAYRSIVLGSNAGGASFHFHAGNEVGTARIVCSVTDPRDKTQKSAAVDIVIGGATGKPASLRVEGKIPYYLGTKSNTNSILNQMAIDAFVMDDSNQPTSSTSGANVQVSILPGTPSSTTSADNGARLVAGTQSGSTLQLPSVGGVALFSLISGENTGPINLQLVSDRYDNNVSNGIQDPILAIHQVPVIENLTYALVVNNEDLGTLTNTIPYYHFLTAQYGLPPYTWSVTGLPSGLTLDSATGLISGTPKDTVRDYKATVTVVDKNKLKAEAKLTLKLIDPVDNIKPEDFYITGCQDNQINSECNLPNAYVASNYVYAFTASVSDVTWSFSGLPKWLSGSSAGGTSSNTAGVVSGTPGTSDCGPHAFLVTASKGTTSVTRKAVVFVDSGMTTDNQCKFP